MSRLNRYFLLLPMLMSALLSSSPALAQVCSGDIAPTRPDSRYIDLGNGAVLDLETNLMWTQCLNGQSGNNCASGSPVLANWEAALSAAASANTDDYTDWRLPSIRELGSLVETQCYSPAINETLFPNLPANNSLPVWSSTPYAGSPLNAWYTGFGTGTDVNADKSSLGYALFVRDAGPIYRPLIEQANNRCLELSGGSTANNTVITTATCNNSASQQWWFDPASKKIRSAAQFSACLDNLGGTSTVRLWQCSVGNIDQQFYWQNNSLRLSSNRDYALTAGASNNAAVFGSLHSAANTAQQWSWGSYPGAPAINYSTIVNDGNGNCLEVQGGVMANGTNVRHAACSAGAARQNWYFNPATEQIISGNNNNYCMDKTNNTGNGDNIIIWTCDTNSNNQKFVPDGLLIRLKANTNIVIDAYSDGNAGQWSANGGINQNWRWVAN